MENSPRLDGKYLGSITKDFVVIANTLKEAAYQLRARKISEYPIFPISKVETPLGKLLIGRGEAALTWNYYFSFAEEFIERKIIEEEGLTAFKQAFKDPEEFCCLFVIDQDFVNFVFVPYPEEEAKNTIEE